MSGSETSMRRDRDEGKGSGCFGDENVNAALPLRNLRLVMRGLASGAVRRSTVCQEFFNVFLPREGNLNPTNPG
jgi:hypothetical protein